MSGVIQVPKILLTDRDGPSQRLRVDPGQTGFFAGRMFRAYYEFSIPNVGPPVYFKFSSPVDFILWSQHLEIDTGGVKLQAFTGATPSGTFTALPAIGVNRMVERPQPYYTSVAGLSIGGTFTDGTEVDLLRVRAASQLVSATNVDGGQDSERGLPAGDYWIKITPLVGINDTSNGIYRIIWEERVP